MLMAGNAPLINMGVAAIAEKMAIAENNATSTNPNLDRFKGHGFNIILLVTFAYFSINTDTDATTTIKANENVTRFSGDFRKSTWNFSGLVDR